MRQDQTKAAGGSFEPTHRFSTERPRTYRFVTQDISQSFNLFPGNQNSIFEKSVGHLSAAPVVDYGLMSDGYLKAERRGAVPCPVSDRPFTDGANDSRGLPHVIETFAGLLIDIGLWVHSRMMRIQSREVIQESFSFFRALPGSLLARSAGVALTGSAPAIQLPGGSLGTSRRGMTTELPSQVNGDGRLSRSVQIRAPRMDDVPGIARLVEACQPFLTAHVSYLYWIYTRYYSETCALAEVEGRIAAWCHANPVGGGKYFSHQTAVAPWARGLGLGRLLWAHLLNHLKQEPSFVLEFTIERRNIAALKMLAAAAKDAGLCLTKSGETASLLEADCCEELYLIAPARSLDGFGPLSRSDATGIHA